ncbi:MAG: DUF86 domain-containing protein [Leptolyngbyaceae cyanobacterium RM2_2_4]|nr:DUF86 domain-containing protein [Leptolyngbyaceae cyanobacterium SM1_4_3]NJO50445.1 DUF86 domain-containing protein [Leptolyngbyaceae cyanobacterium RM2_2_4]
MTGLNHVIVNRKLQKIVKYLAALKPLANLDAATYLNDFNQQLIAERLLHLIVEAAADLNFYLLVQSGHAPPETYYDSFTAAGQQGVIDLTLAQQLAPSAGLRNRLVHEYDEIDSLIVLQAIPFALDLYPKFVEQIQAYLTRNHSSLGDA